MADAGIKYKQATMEDFDIILDALVNKFVKHEPFQATLGLNDANSRSGWGGILKACLQDPVSFIALNEENQLIGFRLAIILTPTTTSKLFALIPEPKTPKFAEFLELWDQYVIPENELPPFDKMLHFFGVWTDKNYRRFGIAIKLIELTMKKGKEMDCDLVWVEATNSKSQNLFKKLGFQMVKEKEYTGVFRETRTLEFQKMMVLAKDM